MNRFKLFLIEYEAKLVLLAGFILVISFSFRFGYLEGEKVREKPVVIEKPIECQNSNVTDSQTVENNLSSSKQVVGSNSTDMTKNCAYVGSKNSNKVHLPTCLFAKKIKPENLVCFKSLDDAIKQGRVADKSCIK
jgi:hypothetical protein